MVLFVDYLYYLLLLHPGPRAKNCMRCSAVRAGEQELVSNCVAWSALDVSLGPRWAGPARIFGKPRNGINPPTLGVKWYAYRLKVVWASDLFLSFFSRPVQYTRGPRRKTCGYIILHMGSVTLKTHFSVRSDELP